MYKEISPLVSLSYAFTKTLAVPVPGPASGKDRAPLFLRKARSNHPDR